MMEWTLAILFGVAVLLFILSFIKTEQSTKGVHKQIEQHSHTFTEEINKLQEKIRNLELDAEITAHEIGVEVDLPLVREVLDLHKRGYQMDSIALKKQLTPAEVEEILTPYIKTKIERGTVANER